MPPPLDNVFCVSPAFAASFELVSPAFAASLRLLFGLSGGLVGILRYSRNGNRGNHSPPRAGSQKTQQVERRQHQERLHHLYIEAQAQDGRTQK